MSTHLPVTPQDSPTKSTVYLETSFISYLTSRLSRNVIVRGNQEVTQQWWANRRQDYRLHASQLVIAEAEKGDPKAAADRLLILQPLIILEATSAALFLSQQLIGSKALPEKAVRDATHLAIAAAHGIEYLVTWNCAHLANARLRKRIERVCLENGFPAVCICTPLELLKGKPNV